MSTAVRGARRRDSGSRRAASAGRRVGQGSLTHPSRTGLLLVSPAVLFVGVFVLVPLVFALVISLTNWPLIGTVKFSGLKNYTAIVSDAAFAKSVLYTLLYTVIVTGPILVLGYALAILVRRKRRGSTLLRTVFFLPFVVGLSTLSFVTVLEAQPESGVINIVLKKLGITDGTTAWLVDGPLATGLICVLVIWAVSGLTMMLLMAGMQSIPRDLYEAASVDGAGNIRQWRNITLPSLRPVNLVLVLVLFLWTFSDFNTPYVLFGTAQPPAGDLITFHIYNASFLTWNFGTGAAMSVLLLIFLMIVTGAYLLVTGRRSRRA